MKITFYGAARTVTGSCHMIETNGKKFLIDCGLFQGKLTDQMLNYEEFPFDVQSIDFVILTHAHIDHSGRIPKLYKAGYRGVVYSTIATKDLCTIMLADSGHIQEKEIEWVNRKRKRAGKKPNEPIYTVQDAIDCMDLFQGVDYNEEIVIDEHIRFRLIDAGHMLGSAIIELWITEDGKEEKIVFTGDLGNTGMPIIQDPTFIESADHLIMESTYGDRLHSPMKDQSSIFIQTILDTIHRGGNVIIPSFAVGRTQEILYEINKYYAESEALKEEFTRIPVYVDSPLAVSATKIFEQNPEYYDEDTLRYLLQGDNPIGFENLHFVESAEDSKALNEDMTPKVIISASGMCEVGRIKHHLKHNLYRPECTILFVGYQAEGTLGEKIQRGDSLVKIFDEEIAVNAEVKYLDAFSGHADQAGLMNWLNHMEKKPKNIFLVHGEPEAQEVLCHKIKDELDIPVIIPNYEEVFDMDGSFITQELTNEKSARFTILELLSALKQDVDGMTNIVKAELKNNVETSDMLEILEKLKDVKEAIENVKS